MNFTIIKQLPTRVQEILSTVDYANTDRILQTLAKLDSSPREQSYESRSNSMNNHVHRPQNNNNASNTSTAANWRVRGNTNTASSERSQPARNPNDQNRQGLNSANVNLRTINIRRDEYNTGDDLCWDVEGERNNAGEMLARMTSPRIHAMIADKK